MRVIAIIFVTTLGCTWHQLPPVFGPALAHGLPALRSMEQGPIHPSMERVLGPRLQHPAVLTLLERFGSPAQIRKAGRRRLVTLLRPTAPRMAERLVEEIFAALEEQTVTVPGTEAATLIAPSLAASSTAGARPQRA